MHVALTADIHGNPMALETVLATLGRDAGDAGLNTN
jgi:hypothetical protein